VGVTTVVPASTNAVAIVPISDCTPCAGMIDAAGSPMCAATASRKSA
jgi:hypothetical protein